MNVAEHLPSVLSPLMASLKGTPFKYKTNILSRVKFEPITAQLVAVH